MLLSNISWVRKPAECRVTSPTAVKQRPEARNVSKMRIQIFGRNDVNEASSQCGIVLNHMAIIVSIKRCNYPYAADMILDNHYKMLRRGDLTPAPPKAGAVMV